MGFRGKNSSAVFVAPAVHFGPFGNLGGSEFSALISKYVASEHDATAFVFHGAATHDFDPVSSSEVTKVDRAVSAALSGMRYESAMGGFSLGKSKSCRALALNVNGTSFIGLSRAPRTTEDINFAVGLSLKNAAEKLVRHAIIVDAHNAETGDIKFVEPGDPLVFEMEEAITDALSKKARPAALRLGIASRKLALRTVGDNGLRLALFEAGGKHLALVLLDANGIQPSARRALIDAVRAYGRSRGISCESRFSPRTRIR